MAFEINRPIQFLPPPTLMKGAAFGALDFTHHKHQQNSSSEYPSAYNNDTTTNKPSLGAESLYDSFAPSSPPYYHIPLYGSLAASHTSSEQFGSYSTDLDTSLSPLSSSPPLRKRDNGQQRNELSSPLPTNTFMYESYFEQNCGTNIKVPSQPTTSDIILPQQHMMWKQDLYSPPLADTNTSWTHSHQEENVLGRTTSRTPRSLSGSPSLHHRNSMISNNMPPCNCIPMIHYDPMYNHSDPPLSYHSTSAMALASSSTPSIHSEMYSDLTNSKDYFHQSQQRLSMDQSYHHPSLDLSPSSSSSSSDNYSHQQRYSTNNNPTTSSSSSSSHTVTTAATTPRRYKCTVCVKRFTRPSSLATHMHSHTGEKPYKCLMDGCGRRFSVVSNLRRHAKIHLHTTSVVGSGRKLRLA
ncbi:hypothetical protein BCR42DRAFT_426630 [Absidia repens]|uniref:C2H2-type domain-containing protein n=1 Tax=Absidia repens TaxID=90262 RepID=A0A1X2I0S0_9FUNG|nr:hypothetical protein BCR42DRAFT_426630 [Absidia repens]